jgi:hypothetical protein
MHKPKSSCLIQERSIAEVLRAGASLEGASTN